MVLIKGIFFNILLIFSIFNKAHISDIRTKPLIPLYLSTDRGEGISKILGNHIYPRFYCSFRPF